MDPEVCAPEPLHAANPHEPRPAHDRVVAVVAVLAAAVASLAMWREAVDHRAASRDGQILGWALPFSAVAVALVLWLITAVLDADRPRAVRILATVLLATTALGWWVVVAATHG